MTDPQARPRRRPQLSLRQEYEEFILQRIEEFKDQLSREQLLAIADEAVRELEVDAEDQLLLTEVLVLEHVDRLIMRRLNLPTFRRWRDRHVRLRRAQREPGHWGLSPDCPLVSLAETLPDEWVALVTGQRVIPMAFFLAAHDWPVLFIDQELAAVEAAESRAAAEALARRFQALVVGLGGWFPDVQPGLAVVDAATLAELDGDSRLRFLSTLQRRTPFGGVHCLIPPDNTQGVRSLTLDLARTSYRGWRLEKYGAAGARWLVATKTQTASDTDVN